MGRFINILLHPLILSILVQKRTVPVPSVQNDRQFWEEKCTDSSLIVQNWN